MYEICYYQDWSSRYILLATCSSLDEACALRKVSGDLVVDSATDTVVADPRWLWDWEKHDPRAYARRNLGQHRPGKLFGRNGVLSP